MHTQSVIARESQPAACLQPVATIKAGRTFIRPDSPSEVLVPLSHAGVGAPEGAFTWCVVIAVNQDSAGYVPGQLLKLRSYMLVRPVHEARAPVYALEH